MFTFLCSVKNSTYIDILKVLSEILSVPNFTNVQNLINVPFYMVVYYCADHSAFAASVYLSVKFYLHYPYHLNFEAISC